MNYDCESFASKFRWESCDNLRQCVKETEKKSVKIEHLEKIITCEITEETVIKRYDHTYIKHHGSVIDNAPDCPFFCTLL